MSIHPPLLIDGQPLTTAAVLAVARHHQNVLLGDNARRKIQQARAVVEDVITRQQVVYGVNTGFGSLSRVSIPPEAIRDVQRNLIRSHSAGIGALLPVEIVRAVMIVQAGSLSRGFSGVRIEVVETLLALLNTGITPVVPSRGSVGASGDLAPLSHIALALIGEGDVIYHHERIPARLAMDRESITPVTLQAKEGLALINGTHLMTGMTALLVEDAYNLLQAAVVAAALSIDANRATDTFLDARVHDIRHHPGQIEIAAWLRQLLANSTILPSHKTNDPRVQDPYSLRCTPQVLGAAADMINHVAQVVSRELGAVSDNPLVFPDNGDIISAGNFHGLPLALALDALKIAIAHIAGISERRVYHLLSAADSENPINPHLSPQPGLHSGLMIAQYTAAAACNEIQTLAAPASVHNIPTSAGMEDYNSMGVTAAHQTWQALDLARHVIAVEFLCSAEALEYQRPLHSGDGVEYAYNLIREVVPRLTADRPLYPDIQNIAHLIYGAKFKKVISP